MLQHAYLGYADSVDRIYKNINPHIHKRHEYLNSQGMWQELSNKGIRTHMSAFNSQETLHDRIKHGKPVIALVNYGTLMQHVSTEFNTFDDSHFAVVAGMDDSTVYLLDPFSTQRHRQPYAIPMAAWMQIWTDTYKIGQPTRWMMTPAEPLPDFDKKGNGKIPAPKPIITHPKVSQNTKLTNTQLGVNYADDNLNLLYMARILTNGVRIRSAPVAHPSTDTQKRLNAGNVVVVYQELAADDDVWMRIGGHMWVARIFDGEALAEKQAF